MWQALRVMSPAPLGVHRAFGFNLQEGWREDGFCLTFPTSQVGFVSLHDVLLNLSTEVRARVCGREARVGERVGASVSESVGEEEA